MDGTVLGRHCPSQLKGPATTNKSLNYACTILACKNNLVTVEKIPNFIFFKLGDHDVALTVLFSNN
jgi:hypothetical protein